MPEIFVGMGVDISIIKHAMNILLWPIDLHWVPIEEKEQSSARS